MKNSWKIVLMAGICFILGTSEYVIVGVLDKIASSCNISIGQAGQLITVFAITVSIATPFLIHLTSGINQRNLLIIALIFVDISCLLMIISPSYIWLLLSRIVMAMGVGVFNVLSFIVATKLALPEKKGSAVATVTMGFNAALIIGLPIGRSITHIFGWKAIFVFTAVLSLISIIAVIRFIPSFKNEKQASFRDELKQLKKPNIILSLLTSVFWIMSYSMLYAYITPYLQQKTTMGEKMLSTTFLVFGIATLVGNKSGGYLGEKIGLSKTILFSLFLNVTALVLLSLASGSAYLTILLLILWGMAVWIPGPLLRYSIIALAPESPGVILSLYNSIVQFGLATGAAIGGIEIEKAGAHILSWSSAFLILISICFAFLFLRHTSPVRKIERELKVINAD
jgi:DHA1 family putative efflux transporter-like MFS transporter